MGIIKYPQDHLSEGPGLTIGIESADDPFLIDAETFQGAGGISVLALEERTRYLSKLRCPIET